jgi:amidase
MVDDLPPNVKLLTMVGTYLRQHYHSRIYAKAQNLRPSFRAQYDEVLSQVDVLAMPTTPMKAHLHEADLDLRQFVARGGNITSNTVAFDVTGHPAISLPCALSEGLPVGLMLVGRHFDDASVLAIAHAVEQQIDWRAA